jgi:hypothetical protein
MRVAETLRHLVGPLELIHAQAGPRLLRWARRGIVGLWMAKLLLDPLWRLADFPRELFRPTGILALFPDALTGWLLSGPGLISLWLATVAVLAGCLGERLFRAVSVPAAFLLTVYTSLIRGFGPAIHTDIVLLLAVYALALFSWADYFAPASPRAKELDRRASYPLVTIVALLCLSYCLVGVNRTVAGGARVFTGDTMEVWAIDASLRGYYFNTNVGWHVPQWPLVALMLKLGLPGITVFEMTAPLCLAWARYRWVFLPVMLSFHLLSLVFMNIFFFDDMFLYLLLIDWSRRFPGLSKGGGDSNRKTGRG